jgi:hypothetical protein
VRGRGALRGRNGEDIPDGREGVYAAMEATGFGQRRPHPFSSQRLSKTRGFIGKLPQAIPKNNSK